MLPGLPSSLLTSSCRYRALRYVPQATATAFPSASSTTLLNDFPEVDEVAVAEVSIRQRANQGVLEAPDTELEPDRVLEYRHPVDLRLQERLEVRRDGLVVVGWIAELVGLVASVGLDDR
jgi:hypothetical protein